MPILGISSIDCESAVSILEEGQILWAASEERFTRVKQQSGFPYKAVDAAFSQLGLTPEKITDVTYPFLGAVGEMRCKLRNAWENIFDEAQGDAPWDQRIYHGYRTVRLLLNQALRMQPLFHHRLMAGLRQLNLQNKVRFLPHHHTHAASAYYTSGMQRCLVVVMDGYGSGECSTVWLGENGALKQVASVPSPHSLGNMYAFATAALGFRPNRHEGKILGLAAHGNPHPVADELRRTPREWPGQYRLDTAFAIAQKARHFTKLYKREDIAAGFQLVLEEVGVNFVRHYVKKHACANIALAGGVMANVKLNQRIAEIPEVENTFVFPAMADPGTSVGGALMLAAERKPLTPSPIGNVYYGPAYDQKQVERAIDAVSLSNYCLPSNPMRVARLLARGFVVARFAGAMEFGPRALCNRTILCQATDATINDTLNKRLKRTEFMPFAPVTLWEHAESCYRNVEVARHAAEFMTITFDCTEQMRRNSPAAVHVDGTARPQLIQRTTNPQMYAILEAYFECTGIPTLINTSFNMHEEPIVCTPQDALRSFLAGELDFIELGGHIIANPKNQNAVYANRELSAA